MYTKLNASRSYVYAVARACDRGKISRRVSIMSISPGEYLLYLSHHRIVRVPFCTRQRRQLKLH